MPEENQTTDDIFPKDTNKTYALVELVRKKGPMVGKGPEDTVFSFPVILLIEVILLLAVTLGIYLFSLVKQAPLGEIANPMVTTDPAKAPWYFVGLQELLEHMHPTLAGIFIPGALVGFLILLPFLDSTSVAAGAWFGSRKAKRIAFFTAIYTAIAMPVLILFDNTFTLREILRPLAPPWVAQGLAPGGILLLVAFLPTILLLLRGPSTRREILTSIFTIIVVSAFVFTVSGFLFRGPGFKLYWPWDMPDGYNPWDEF